MRLFKWKTQDSLANGIVSVNTKYSGGYALEVKAVFFSSTNPSAELALLDKDGDQFMFTITGQASPSVVTPDVVSPIVNLPITYVDSEGGNEIIIWGIVHEVQS